MALSTSMINAAQTLINTFGNNANLYSYSGSTKSTDSEGQDTISDWKTATVVKVVDGGNAGSEIVNAMQGRASIGEDEKIIRNDVTIAVNDRLTYNGSEYRVEGLRAERIESVDIIQIIKVVEVDSTTIW